MSSELNKNKYGKTVLVLVLASLLFSVSAFAQVTTYTVRNDVEMETVLKEPGDKEILLIDNIIVYAGTEFEVVDNVKIILDRFNFQGNNPAVFKGNGNLTIVGSTTAFNGGFELTGNVSLTYDGTYMMSGTDRFGTTAGDDVTVNLITPGSVWQGSILPGPYLHVLEDPPGVDATRDGTIIIGDAGTATMNVENMVKVRNSETILGAQIGSEGSLHLKGSNVDWFTSGSFYVGYGGKGTLDISDGIVLKTGSIVVGKETTANGELNIFRAGTVVNIYGRDEGPTDILKAEGIGVMNLTGGALLNFDDSETLLGDISGYTPKLGLGEGASVVTGSTIRGARLTDPGNGEKLIGPSGFVTNQPDYMIDQNTIGKFDQAGWIVGTTDGDLLSTNWNNNSLTLRNNSVLEGSLNISMQSVVFGNRSTLTPGEGEYDSTDFGRINFITNEFNHQSGAATYIDFSVHGDTNFDYTVASDPRVQSGVYDEGYTGDRGRDVISVTGGTAILAGNIYFRPQSGYYSDNIDVHFMELLSGTMTGQYTNVTITPNRWFSNPLLDTTAGNGNHLVMSRNTTPFTDAAITNNTTSVGGALEEIYNKQTNAGWLEVLDWMWLMDDQTLRRAMHELAGETRASSFLMPVRSPWKFAFDRPNVNDVVQNQRERQRTNCDPNAFYSYSEVSKNIQNGLWAAPFYEFLNASDDGNASATTNSRVGFMFGFDRVISNRSTLGFLFAYSHPELKQLNSRVRADDYLLGLYFNTTIQKKYELKLWGSYGAQAYRMNRTIVLPNADGRLTSSYTGNTAALSSQIAMPVQWRKYVLRPLAALDLNYVQQNGAMENGYEAIRLHYHNSDWVQLLGRIGVKTDYSYKCWDMNASVAYSCLFAGDSAPTVRNQFVTDGPAFDIEGNDLGSHFFALGLGGQRWLNEQKTRMFFVQYNGDYGRRSNVQTAALGCQFVF